MNSSGPFGSPIIPEGDSATEAREVVNSLIPRERITWDGVHVWHFEGELLLARAIVYGCLVIADAILRKKE